MDKNINIAPKEIAPGVFSTGGTATMPTVNPINNQPNVITPEALQIQPQINLQTPPELQTSKPSVEGDIAFYNQLQNQQSAQEQQLLAEKTAGNQGIEKLLKDFSGQGQEQLSLEQQIVNPINTQITDLTGQVGVDIADYQKAEKDYEKLKTDLEVGVRGSGNADIRASMLFGQQGAVDRAKASELNVKASAIAVKQAQILALQGKADLAQKQIDRAIDLKYKGIEQEINIKKFQLDNIKENLTKEEKKRAEALNFALSRDEKRVAEQKENEKAIENMLIQAGVYQAPTSLLNEAKNVAKNGGKPSDVARLLGKYSPDYLDYKLKKAQIYKTGVEAEKAQLELNQTKNAIKAAENATGISFAMLSEKQQDTALKLRDKYNAESKEFVTIRDAYNRIQTSSVNPSAAGDLALIFNYMKVLDPGSTVREGEFATAQTSAGVPERIRAQYNKAIKGERLTESTRKDFVERAELLFKGQQSQQQKINENYDFISTSANIPKEFITRDITSAVSSEQEALDNVWNATNPPKSNPTNQLDSFLKFITPPKQI